MSAEEDDIAEWWRSMLSASEDRREAIETAYQQLENAGRVSKVTVHRYVCVKGGHLLSTVIRLGEVTIARTCDYKLAPNTNLNRSVESARRKNTLDGDRHWPGHTFDISHLATWGEVACIDMNCRHGLRTVRAVDILAVSQGVRPGHPSKPTLI